MEQMARKTLEKWATSLINYGKVDRWKINDDFIILNNFISGNVSTEAKIAVRACRDYVISEDYDADILLSKLKKAKRIIESSKNYQSRNGAQNNHFLTESKRYETATKKIYEEKLRFRDGQYLKSFDIEIEDVASTKKVRRIVEKRMGQAYHHQHKQYNREDGHKRFYMKNAILFQLHNLGQIECGIGTYRSEHTHWKKTYDSVTNKKVLKAKKAYSSFEKADEAANKYNIKHPNEVIPMSAYKCDYCSKWHIGHYTPEEYKSNRSSKQIA